jgi:hypothetical protein
MPRLKRNLNVLGVIGNTRSFVESFLIPLAIQGVRAKV